MLQFPPAVVLECSIAFCTRYFTFFILQRAQLVLFISLWPLAAVVWTLRLKLRLGTTLWPKLGVPGDASSLTSEPKSPDFLRVTSQLLLWNENHRLVEDKKGSSGDALTTGPPELRLAMAAL